MKPKFVFISLSSFFLMYSIIVYTDGTVNTQGLERFTSSAKAGKLLFQKHNCIACHQVYGLGGYMGPDLTNVLSGDPNAEILARSVLKSGTIKMPDFHLSQKEVDHLIAYLRYLDGSGTYPSSGFTVSWLGTVKSGSEE